MILQALVNYYERLATGQEKIPAYGWSSEKISYCIVLKDDGSIQSIEPTKDEITNPKTKKVTSQPKSLIVPMLPEGRPGKVVKANYLWDNTAYVLGISAEKSNSTEKYQAFWDRVREFDATNSKALQVLQNFPDFWNEHKQDHEAEWNTKDFLDSNIVFRVLSLGNQFAHDCDEFKKQWQGVLEQYLSGFSDGQCLIDGTTSKIADLHKSIKGVDNAQSSGALLVSFNKDAFESYGLKKGKNASVGTTAAFKYVTALNYLLRRGEDNKQRLKIGDAVTVFWAEANQASDADFAEAFFAETINPTDGQETASLASVLQQVAKGIPLQTLRPDLNPATKFYVLGISPNAARLSIRFWYATTLEEMARHIAQHYQDVYLEPQQGNGLLDIRKLTYATAPIYTENGQQKTDSDKIPPQLAGNLARAVFTGQLYPQSALSQVLMRMRLDGVVSFTRVSICKAVINREIRLNKKTTQEIPMSLDVEEKNVAYRMGRLFAVLESIQKEALGKDINATIRDRYWGAASATPALVFPMLERNMMNHLAKIRKEPEKQKLSGFFDWQIGSIKDGMPTFYPKSLNLQEQGRFAIGYYHQRFTRHIKTEKGIVENPVAAGEETINQDTQENA